MPIYFAPLEGVTDSVFRRTHAACFSGVDKYFIPFISPTQNMFFTARELSAIAPDENAGLSAVPQIMAKDARLFLWAAEQLKDMGYAEINLNIGCPSGTVTAKGKGAGILRTPDELTRLLDEIYARTPLPVSIKTRIGYESAAEWPRIVSILSDYPVHELIVHPRTRSQFYSGMPHRGSYALTFECTRCPIVYNGDLFTPADCEALLSEYPDTSALMLGRGLIANPALAQEISGGERLTLPALRRFHDMLLAAYLERGPANLALIRMQAFMKHAVCCFEAPDKPRKALRKAKSIRDYSEAAERLFEGHRLLDTPCFLPDPNAIH